MDILERDVHKRRDLKIGRKKVLSGLEAARLLLANSMEVDHNRPGILTDTQREAIIRGEYFRTATDSREYNSWLKVFRMTDFSCRESTIAGLRAVSTLYRGCSLISLVEKQTMAGKLNETEERALFDWLRQIKNTVPPEISLVMAAFTVLDSVSRLLKVRLHEDVTETYTTLAISACIFNASLERSTLSEEDKKRHRIKRTSAKKGEIRYFEERIDMALGKHWNNKTPYRHFYFQPAQIPEGFTGEPLLLLDSLQRDSIKAAYNAYDE